MMRDYGKIHTDMATWTDEDGTQRRTPSSHRLSFKIPSHAAIRAFVMRRDGFMCKWCGAQARDVPGRYDGQTALSSDRLIPARGRKRPFSSWAYLYLDHIRSLRNGGANHPTNMQVLCEVCNAAKSGLIDSKFKQAEAA